MFASFARATCLALLFASALPHDGGTPGPGTELSFTGSSPAGSFQEALDAALRAARTELARHSKELDFRWELAQLGGREAASSGASTLLVTLRITSPLPPALQKKTGPRRLRGRNGFLESRAQASLPPSVRSIREHDGQVDPPR